MIVKPKVRGFICTTSHPTGCKENVRQQIEYVKSPPKTHGPKKVLVIGASMGMDLLLVFLRHILAEHLQSALFLISLVQEIEQVLQAGIIQPLLRSSHTLTDFMQKQLTAMLILRKSRTKQSHLSKRT